MTSEEIAIRIDGKGAARCPRGTSVRDLLPQWNGKTEEVVAARVNGRLVDLAYGLEEETDLEWVTLASEEGRQVYRHSTSHIMAYAVQQLFPGTQITIGPAIEDGFYYDFKAACPFTEEDFERIEARMAEIVAANYPFIRQEVSKEEARDLFQQRGEAYKLELLDGIDEGRVSLYWVGDFVDLCRGPHLPSSGVIQAFKLLSNAGAYWRGDERNEMLQRIYGTAWPSREQLEEYLRKREEVLRRDHRVLGKRLGIFTVKEAAGGGLIYWLPKGTIVRKIIERFWEDEHQRRGYQLVMIPHLVRDTLFRTSGHFDYYRDSMYVVPVDREEYVVKPMNCPGHILLFQDTVRSYRDMPVRFAELGTVYRYERSGTLHGMLRVRGFTQDDAHIFCTPEQLPDEILGVFDLAAFLLAIFGYKEYEVDLSVRDPNNKGKYIGGDEAWERAEEVLAQCLDRKGWSYRRREGEAVFYGPKVDIKMLDVLGRGWQGPTIQVDFNLPERFDLRYVGSDGIPHRVVMVHRTVLGSMERFVGGLLEHYGGSFPLWLAPVQARVMSITNRQDGYAAEVAGELAEAGMRAEADLRAEKINYKIREAQQQRIPYMLVVGAREVTSRTVAVRHRDQGDLGPASLPEVRDLLLEEIAQKSTLPLAGVHERR